MRVILDGMDCFKEYKRALEGARRRIWICMYMIRFDDYTSQIWDILEEKRREGVEVRVLYDIYGCFRTLPRLAFSPVAKAFIPRWSRLGSRNHAKLILVDDRLGIISGRNFTKRYYKDWVDTSTFVDEPEIVRELVLFSRRMELRPEGARDHRGRIVITDPLEKNRSVYNFVLENIVKARKEIVIMSPYFVIDDAIENLLLAAADRGVKITVVIPNKPEHSLASTFNRINFQRIHHRNVFAKKSRGMFHSKVMLFDNIALIGSANFDNRSFKWNYELSIVPDRQHIRLIKRHVDEVAHKSVRYNWIQRVYDKLLFNFTRHFMEFL